MCCWLRVLHGRCEPQHPELWKRHRAKKAHKAGDAAAAAVLPAWDGERFSIFAAPASAPASASSGSATDADADAEEGGDDEQQDGDEAAGDE